MKKNLIIFFLFCITTTACKKYAFDYRNKFIGSYDFNIHYTSWWGGGPPIGSSTDTLYNYKGKVEMGNENNTVLIFFSNGVSFESTIYEDGTLENHSGTIGFLGEFESTKKIKFNYSYWWPNGHESYSVTGEKK